MSFDISTPPQKFYDPEVTANGATRARVQLTRLETLWFNTGSLCNIECANCYILSSPKNDDLLYLTTEEILPILDEAVTLGTREIGLTGGEPFMNPEIIEIMEEILQRGFDLLVLTNAMKPLMRPRVQLGLQRLHAQFADQITLRISIDHHTKELHETERGPNSWQPMLLGMQWLAENNFSLTAAGRTCWNEDEESARQQYQALFSSLDLPIDATDPSQLVLFPEMDETGDPPEITTECWSILNKSPDEMMCATSRMVVHHKGAERASVQACTLLAYDRQFDLGSTLMDAKKSVPLNHPHCATFCVLGGGSCSA
ncbi:MAG: radical SAM protein [bacterium]